MIYGFPLSISDADCDVEPLDPYDPWSITADGQPSSTDQTTLLLYKCSMSSLSRIVKSALEALYRSRKLPDEHRHSDDKEFQLQRITRLVTSFDTQLTEWYSNIPAKLELGNLSEYGTSGRNNKPMGDTFEEQLYQLQALALKLALENARILVHRPILSYKYVGPSVSSSNRTLDPEQEALATSIKACRDAALQISWAGHMPIFKQASTTYALNFIALHLLTAGTTLSIMTSLSPLGIESHGSKLGIRRLMEIQMALGSNSIVAEQGLQLLWKLLSLIMKKETDKILKLGPRSLPAVRDSEDGADSSMQNDNHVSRDQGMHLSTLPQTPLPVRNIDGGSGGFSTTAADSLASFDFCAEYLMSQAMIDHDHGASAPTYPYEYVSYYMLT